MAHHEGSSKGSGNDDDLTKWLNDLAQGNKAAADKLMPVIQRELMKIARNRLRNERANHTCRTNDLVNDLYIKLFGGNPPEFADRSHFYAIAAMNMRWILGDYARRRKRRADGQDDVATWDDKLILGSDHSWSQIAALNRALEKMETLYPRQAQVAEKRIFAEMSDAEIGRALGISAKTAGRDWKFARAWLYKEMGGQGDPPPEK